MKKALMLAGLVLCTTGGFAAETRNDLVADGQKRNEEAYERILEETGWKKESPTQDQKSESEKTRARNTDTSRSKNG